MNKLPMLRNWTSLFYICTGKAAPPAFKSESVSSEEDKFILEWVAESISNISTFKVEYRPKVTSQTDWWEISNCLNFTLSSDEWLGEQQQRDRRSWRLRGLEGGHRQARSQRGHPLLRQAWNQESQASDALHRPRIEQEWLRLQRA